MVTILVRICRTAGIGRQAGFRFRCRKAYGFEAHVRHQGVTGNLTSMGFSMISRLWCMSFITSISKSDIGTFPSKTSPGCQGLTSQCAESDDPPWGLGGCYFIWVPGKHSYRRISKGGFVGSIFRKDCEYIWVLSSVIYVSKLYHNWKGKKSWGQYPGFLPFHHFTPIEVILLETTVVYEWQPSCPERFR